MAITTQAALCDYALAKIGHKSEAYTVGGTPASDPERRIEYLYEPERDSLMSAHPWNFAIRRVNYDIDDFTYNITGATQANPVVLSVATASTYFSVGDGVYVWNVSGMTDINDSIFVVSAVDATTMTLQKTDRATGVNGTSYTAYTSGGYVRHCPLSEFTYEYVLPSDCLTFWEILDGESAIWTTEGRKLVCDLDELEGKYIKQETTVSNYHPLFIEALALKLAAELTKSLQTTIKKADLLQEFFIVISEARRINAIAKNIKSKGLKFDPSKDIGWQSGSTSYLS